MDALPEIFRETSASPVATDRTARAVQQNRLFAQSLGWGRFLNAIVRTLGIIGLTPGEHTLVAGVRRWQQANGLRPTGVIDAQTWKKIRALLTDWYFKNLPRYQRATLTPVNPIAIDPRWPSARRAMAGAYNRIGGLLKLLADDLKIEVAAILPIWLIESGGRAFPPGGALLRFENHVFYRKWGHLNEVLYRQHFRHGGHAGVPGPPWLRHQYRELPGTQWLLVHPTGGDQQREYGALRLARRLSRDNPAALTSASIGGTQIVMMNHRKVGYATPVEMFDAFQAGERAQVLGFFDFCRRTPARGGGNLLDALRHRRWNDVARGYNGSGQIPTYSAKLRAAYAEASQLPIR